MTSTIATAAHLREWILGASQCFDDPADPVCLLVFRWLQCPEADRGGELACGNLVRGVMDLWLGDDPLPVPVAAGAPEIAPDGGGVVRFGAQRIAPGGWALCPSLNLPGIVHGFAILHGVPEPAPFEQAPPKIWTPDAQAAHHGATVNTEATR